MNEQRRKPMLSEPRQAVKCDCCQLPAAEIVGGALAIRARHHGEQHVTLLSLDYIRRQLERAAQESKAVSGAV